MKLEVGMYVRTDKGFISQIIDFKEHYTKGKRLINSYSAKEVVENYLLLNGNQCEFIESIDYSIPPCYPSDEELEKIKSHIVKASHNIIDLIEERDFVKVRIDGVFINWFMVDLFEDENENQELGIGCYEDGLLNSISEYRTLNTLEILEVLTKEQFESMSYKVGE